MVDEADHRILVNRNMERGEAIPLAGGGAAFVTRRSPDKTTANEDSVVILQTGEASGLIAVADGVGGQHAGEVASAIMVDKLLQIGDLSASPTHSLRSRVLDAIEQANAEICALSMGAATTVAVVEINGPAIRPYHVGDSSIVVLTQGGNIKHRSIAHSPVGYAVEAGMLSEDEALKHDDLHLVDNLVGYPEMRIEIGPPIELAPRDSVLIGSDGLFDNLREHEIAAELKGRTLVQRIDGLADAATARMTDPVSDEPSKPDDLSIVLFRLSQPRRSSESTDDGTDELDSDGGIEPLASEDEPTLRETDSEDAPQDHSPESDSSR